MIAGMVGTRMPKRINPLGRSLGFLCRYVRSREIQCFELVAGANAASFALDNPHLLNAKSFSPDFRSEQTPFSTDRLIGLDMQCCSQFGFGRTDALAVCICANPL
jgi:hypothetical protein